MQCPFLKKVSFKKMNQVVSDESEREGQEESQGEFDFGDQGAEMVNSSEANKHQIYYFNSRITPPQRTHNHLEIRFPKQLQTKKMIHGYPLVQFQQSISDDSVTIQSRRKNVPHILVSKMSMLAMKCQEIFQGEVFLDDGLLYRCELREKKIRIEREQKLKYFVQMQKAECRLDGVKDCRGKLLVGCGQKELMLNLKFPSSEKLNAFVRAMHLNSAQIERQKEEENMNLQYSIDSLGFEVQRMSMQNLPQIANTFDIIIFKNRSWMSRVQRLFTNSDYDHVAMLLKANNGDLFLFESTSNAGVAIYTLQSLLELPKKKHYCRVGYRQYQGERRPQQIYALQEFVKTATGKKYKFDPMYLISSDVKKEDTFFCSELVAQALKRAGLMEKSSPAYKYLPKHFASNELNQSMVLGHYGDVVILD